MMYGKGRASVQRACRLPFLRVPWHGQMSWGPFFFDRRVATCCFVIRRLLKFRVVVAVVRARAFVAVQERDARCLLGFALPSLESSVRSLSVPSRMTMVADPTMT